MRVDIFLFVSRDRLALLGLVPVRSAHVHVHNTSVNACVSGVSAQYRVADPMDTAAPSCGNRTLNAKFYV